MPRTRQQETTQDGSGTFCERRNNPSDQRGA